MQKDYFIQTLVAEVRPRLQSVNVFIRLQNSVENQPVSINLSDNYFEILCANSSSITNWPQLNILTESLSCVKNVNNSISFRFATTGDLGSFKSELLTNNTDDNNGVSKRVIFFESDVNYSIECVNCKRTLNNSIVFQRVLPLPSDNCDPTDWFCHNHNHEGENNDTNFSLNPKESELFYAKCYVFLNRNNVNNTRTSGKTVVCRYCLSWLGLKENNSTLKLWSNTIQVSNGAECYKTLGLTDSFNAIFENIEHILFNSAKVILSCQSNSTKVDYLLLWIIEKKLEIYFTINNGICTKYNVAKVLYRVVDENGIENQWKNDSNVQSVDVSKPMLVDVLKHLHYFNKVFPKEFSTTNDFLVSYLFMYDPFVEDII